jgi:small conductance mechanosensitive channel
VGDTISVQGCFGLVKEITLATTQLVADDGEEIVIPNKHVVSEIHRNSYAYRVVEGSIGVAYSGDPDVAIEVIKKVIAGFDTIAVEPSPQVSIESFSDSSIVTAYRFWVLTPSFFEVQYAVNRGVYKALREANVVIPFPQREVRLSTS